MGALTKMKAKPRGIVKDWYQCETCGTLYPYMRVWDKQDECYYYQIMCNGVEIVECPYCSYNRKSAKPVLDK